MLRKHLLAGPRVVVEDVKGGGVGDGALAGVSKDGDLECSRLTLEGAADASTPILSLCCPL